MKRIFIEADKCNGCRNCSIACMQSHTPGSTFYSLDLTDRSLESRNAIMLDSEMGNIPIICRHCDAPECVTACMSGAMTKDKATGRVLYDADRCGRCFMCVMGCNFGVLKPDRATRSYVVKCDFCADRDEGPNCVDMCPTKALSVMEVEA